VNRSTGLQRHKPWTPTAEQVDRWHQTQDAAQQRYAAKQRGRRSTSLRRAPQIRTEASPSKSRRSPSRAGERRAKQLVSARSGGLCETRIPGLCTTWATDWHHRLNRSQGGRWCASQGLHVCRPCHRVLTTPPPGRLAEFVRNGWHIPAWPKRNPATVPVLTIHGLHPVLLDDHGGFEPANPITSRGAA
jgi:hypothetical protein